MKFKTVIAHKPGTVIDVAGQSFDLQPDADGFAVIDTDNPDVIARLLAIPEGFQPLEPADQEAPSQGGDSLDDMDEAQLRALAAKLGIKVHHNAKAPALRAAITKAQG